MGPVHVYLAAWVAGGVLLGASMLLDQRKRRPAGATYPGQEGGSPSVGDRRSMSASTGPGGESIESAPVMVQAPQGTWSRGLRVVPLGMIGFGLAGLTAKGLNVDSWPWTFLCALAVGVVLIALGYKLSSRIENP